MLAVLGGLDGHPVVYRNYWQAVHNRDGREPGADLGGVGGWDLGRNLGTFHPSKEVRCMLHRNVFGRVAVTDLFPSR